MAKNKKNTTIVSGVLLDCKTPVATGIEFSREHAENLLNLQASQGRDNWVLSEGQGLIFENGKIRNSENSGDTQSESE